MKKMLFLFVLAGGMLFSRQVCFAQNGVINTFAGTGVQGYSGDGGPAKLAQLDTPGNVAVDYSGNVYISTGCRIRKVTPAGIITTIAGNGIPASSGDGGSATAAELVSAAVSIDNAGNIYCVDKNRIRKINTAGIITTIAGTGVAGYNGDGIAATSAKLNYPVGIVADGSGNVYFSDFSNNRIRKINPSGIISTVGGNGVSGFSGDGAAATSANINSPAGLVIDNSGNLFFADYANKRIRKINTSGIISTIAGNGILGSTGDGRQATLAELYAPGTIALDNTGNLMIWDAYTYRIRKVDKNTSIITTIAGGGGSYGVFYGDMGYAYTAGFNLAGMAIDSFNNMYIADGDSRIRKIKSLATINLYFDRNSNCVFDSGEDYLLNPSTVQIDSNNVTIDTVSATSSFNFNIYGITGDIYTFKTVSPSGQATSCPVSGIISDTINSAFGDYFSKNIGFDCATSSGFDLEIKDAIGVTGRHDQVGNIYLSNNSCTPTNATVTVNFSPKYNFQSWGNPTPTSISGNRITWDFTGLALNTMQHPIKLWYANFAPLSALLSAGDTVQTYVTITPITGDINPVNNTMLIIDTVRASCDPNEMFVKPSGYIPSGTQLEYTIGFENVGNDTAFNIYIMDSLSDNVDPKSFRILASSATMNTTMLHTGVHNVLKFDFPNIDLLDSSHHGQCDGMVRFTINTNNGLPDGTTVFNHAGIYFDDNGVVKTNTVEDIIGIPNGVAVVKDNSKVQIYPNPAADILVINIAQSAYSSYTITNNVGQVIAQQQLIVPQTNIDVKSLVPGLYYITLRGAEGVKVEKFVKR